MEKFSAEKQFASLISERLGLSSEAAGREELMELLEKRAKACRMSVSGYLAKLAGAPEWSEWMVLAGHVTVAETYFFRHFEQLEAYKSVLPEYARAAASRGTPVRILSAGCASGEEIYSLIILAAETLPGLTAGSLEALGIDLNEELLKKAATGRYSEWSLRITDDARRQRWFRRSGKEYEIDPDIKRIARFAQMNLTESAAALDQGPFDIIFCRNLMMYLERCAAQRLVDRITKSLHPDGCLFLGPSESLRGYSNEYHLIYSHDAFYYRLREAGEGHACARKPDLDMKPEVRTDESNDSWVHTIHEASGRVARLSKGDAPAPDEAPAAGSLDKALDLWRQDRFDDALRALRSVQEPDADSLLLRAAILTNSGRIKQAEEDCFLVLEDDPMNAGAHYLLALCCEHAGDLRKAEEHDRISIYLDPAFAMPHMHLGLLAGRSGDAVTAEREMQRALVLLGQEDAARILLFGGGFHREALAQICYQALRKLRTERQQES